MSHSVTRFAAALLFSVALVHAADTPAPAKSDAAPVKPDASAAKPEAVPSYELKNRSKFAAVPATARAPFWPIGWVKRAKAGVVTAAPTVAAPRVLLDEKSFRVTSILLGTGTTPSLAVINGRAYSEGEFLRMPKGGTTPPARVRVQRINDGTVILQNADQIMVASITRPELSNKRTEDLVLDPDR